MHYIYIHIYSLSLFYIFFKNILTITSSNSAIPGITFCLIGKVYQISSYRIYKFLRKVPECRPVYSFQNEGKIFIENPENFNTVSRVHTLAIFSTSGIEMGHPDPRQNFFKRHVVLFLLQIWVTRKRIRNLSQTFFSENASFDFEAILKVNE